jgi:hypothetical protein
LQSQAVQFGIIGLRHPDMKPADDAGPSQISQIYS